MFCIVLPVWMQSRLSNITAWDHSYASCKTGLMVTETLCKAPGGTTAKNFVEKPDSSITQCLLAMQRDACLRTDVLFVFPTLSSAPARDLCPS